MRGPPEEVAGPATSAGGPVDAAGEPDVLRLVRIAAEAVGAPLPSEVWLTLDSAVALRRERRGPVLRIGAPWLAATARADLVLAAAHALAAGPAAGGPPALLLGDEDPIRPMPSGGLVARSPGRFARAAGRLRRSASRRRLAAADRACVAAFGPDAFDHYLRAAYRRDHFSAYMAGDVEPCLAEGFAPPILDGWVDLLAEPGFRERIADGLAAARLAERRERAAAGVVDGVPPPLGAVALETPFPRLERRLLAAARPDRGVLVDLSWDRAVHAVWLPRLRRRVAAGASGFEPFRLGHITEALAGPPGACPPVSTARVETVSATVVEALLEEGWTLEVPLGSPLQLRRGELTIAPFALCAAAGAGTLPAAEWAAFAEEAAVADVLVVPARPARGPVLRPLPVSAPGPGAGPGPRRSPPSRIPAGGAGRHRRRRLPAD
ncbi:MAG: hypothetical protein QOF77_754 [Solirubrobacteraceae bacterium]|nr:hypothetical protein [Solirubrobacteraceae bacterium]